MSTIEDLIGCVEREPLNEIVVAMLTDALIGERDMTRSEADRHVANVRAVALEARWVREATALLAPGTDSECRLRHAIMRAVTILPLGNGCIVVVAGSTKPSIAHTFERPGNNMLEDVTITVGARWLVQQWRLHLLRKETKATKQRMRRMRQKAATYIFPPTQSEK